MTFLLSDGGGVCAFTRPPPTINATAITTTANRFFTRILLWIDRIRIDARAQSSRTGTVGHLLPPLCLIMLILWEVAIGPWSYPNGSPPMRRARIAPSAVH